LIEVKKKRETHLAIFQDPPKKRTTAKKIFEKTKGKQTRKHKKIKRISQITKKDNYEPRDIENLYAQQKSVQAAMHRESVINIPQRKVQVVDIDLEKFTAREKCLSLMREDICIQKLSKEDENNDQIM